MTAARRNKVYLEHDAIPYTWDDVPVKKYENWRAMTSARINTVDFTTPGLPYWLMIEPTSFCNLSCAFCPAGAGHSELKRERRHMTAGEFKSIIDDMADYLLFVILWDWGEPLMNPHLPDMIRYASARGIKSVTSTNGHFFRDESYLRELLGAGLTTMIVAIESLNPEHYTSYRKGGNVGEVIAGLERVMAIKKEMHSSTLINLRMVLMKANEGDISEMRSKARELDVDIFTVKTVNPRHSFSFTDDEAILPRDPRFRRYVYKAGTYEPVKLSSPSNCYSLWSRGFIHSNGNVVACGRDYAEEMTIGNVFEQPMSALWNGKPFREWRRSQHYEKDTLSLCKACDVNYERTKGGEWPEVRFFHMDIKQDALRRLKNMMPESLKKVARRLRSGIRS